MSETPPRGGVLERGLLIGGESVAASSGRLADDVGPWDGGIYARVAAGPAPDIARAADAAQAAFPGWSQTGAFARREIFLRAADVMAGRGGEVITALARGDRGVPGVRRVQPGVLRPGAARGRGGGHPPGG